MSSQNAQRLQRVLCFLVIFWGSWISIAHAQLTVQIPNLNLSFELPVNFKQVPKDSMGEASLATLGRCVASTRQGASEITFDIERISEPLTGQTGHPAGETSVENWKSLRLPVEESQATDHGVATMTLSIDVPLEPQDLRFSIRGPPAQARMLRTTLHAMIGSLRGSARLVGEVPATVPEPETTPAKQTPPRHAANEVTPRPFAPVPQREPMEPLLSALFIVGVGVFCFKLYSHYRGMASITRNPGYGLLIAISLGVILATVTGRNPYGSTELIVTGSCCAVSAFAYWRIVRLSKRPQLSAVVHANFASRHNVIDWTTKSDLYSRCYGLLVLVLVGEATYLCAVDTLQKAKAERPAVLFLHGHDLLVLLPLISGFSLALVVFGKRFLTSMPSLHSGHTTSHSTFLPPTPTASRPAASAPFRC